MVSRPFKTLAILVALSLLLPACGTYRVVHKKKPVKVAQKKKASKKERKRTANVAKGQFLWPADGPVNSPYGWRWGRMHDGIDIGGDGGDPILASARGEVVFSDKLGGYGNLIVIKHPNGFFTAYGHNKKNLAKKGKRVKQGELIARMGRTGRATGDHLHFEIRDNDGTFDPQDILSGSRIAARPEKNLRFDREDKLLSKPKIQIAEGEPDRLEPLVPEAAVVPPAPPPQEEIEPGGMMELLSDL